MVNVNPSFKDLSPTGTRALGNLEQIKHPVLSRAAAPFTAVPFAADGFLNAGMAVTKGATVVVFKTLETLAALVAKDIDLSKSTGLTNYTWNETVGHLSRTGSDIVSMGAAVLGVISPKITVAAARALGAAQQQKKADNRWMARRIFDKCIGNPVSSTASWAKAHPYKAAGAVLTVLGLAYGEYQYGYGMDMAGKAYEYLPERPEFVDNSCSWVKESTLASAAWLGSWVGLGGNGEILDPDTCPLNGDSQQQVV